MYKHKPYRWPYQINSHALGSVDHTQYNPGTSHFKLWILCKPSAVVNYLLYSPPHRHILQDRKMISFVILLLLCVNIQRTLTQAPLIVLKSSGGIVSFITSNKIESTLLRFQSSWNNFVIHMCKNLLNLWNCDEIWYYRRNTHFCVSGLSWVPFCTICFALYKPN